MHYLNCIWQYYALYASILHKLSMKKHKLSSCLICGMQIIGKNSVLATEFFLQASGANLLGHLGAKFRRD